MGGIYRTGSVPPPPQSERPEMVVSGLSKCLATLQLEVPQMQYLFTHSERNHASVLSPRAGCAELLGFLRARLDLLRQLLKLPREGGAETLDRGLDPVDAKFGRQLVVFEQVVVPRRLDRFGRLDRDRAVVLEAGRGRDQLADDHVLLEADKAIPLALQGRVGEHLGRLLEGGGGEEGLGRQRGLGDSEDDLLA